MAKKSLNIIKSWFKTGLFPTQQQFWDTWDSFFHKDDNIPASQVENLQNLLDQKLDKKDLPDGSDISIDDVSGLRTELDDRVNKVAGKGLSTKDYTTEEKNKLAGVEQNANNYQHPATHPAAMINETPEQQFVAAADKTSWNDALSKVNAILDNATVEGDTLRKLYDLITEITLQKVTEAGGTSDQDINLTGSELFFGGSNEGSPFMGISSNSEDVNDQAIDIATEFASVSMGRYELAIGAPGDSSLDIAEISFTDANPGGIDFLANNVRFLTDILIGDGTSGNARVIANNADANKPEVRYNDTDNVWQFSNDGLTFTDLGGGGSVPTIPDLQTVTGKGAITSDLVEFSSGITLEREIFTRNRLLELDDTYRSSELLLSLAQDVNRQGLTSDGTHFYWGSSLGTQSGRIYKINAATGALVNTFIGPPHSATGDFRDDHGTMLWSSITPTFEVWEIDPDTGTRIRTWDFTGVGLQGGLLVAYKEENTIILATTSGQNIDVREVTINDDGTHTLGSVVGTLSGLGPRQGFDYKDGYIYLLTDDFIEGNRTKNIRKMRLPSSSGKMIVEKLWKIHDVNSEGEGLTFHNDTLVFGTMDNQIWTAHYPVSSQSGSFEYLYVGGGALPGGIINRLKVEGPSEITGLITSSGGIRTTGNDSERFGFQALLNDDGTNNGIAAIGYRALSSNTSGGANTALGSYSLEDNTSGNDNTGLGRHAISSNATGHRNTGVGSSVMFSLLSGNDNVAFGRSALRDNTTGSRNSGFGTESGENQIGSDCTYLGYRAGRGSNSDNFTNSTALGANSVINKNNQIVLGDNNVTELKTVANVDMGEVLKISPRSTAPANPSLGWVYVNSSDNHLYFFNGSAWVRLDN